MMGTGVNIYPLVLILIYMQVTLAQNQWNNPAFLPGPPRKEVNITYLTTSTYFEMEEEIVGDVYLGKLNYKGSGKASIGEFIEGIQRYLGATIEPNAEIDPADPNALYLIIKNRQDYETPEMQRYNFYVYVDEENDDGSKTHYRAEVIIAVINIDDNPPIIHLLDTCEIPELFEGMSKCTYLVTDIDGAISIDHMTFTLAGRRNDEEMFHIHEVKFTHTSYEMQITLEVVTQLDFDVSAIHILTVTAFDSLPNNSSQTIVVQVEDVPNMPPRWVSIFAVQQFDEKTNRTFVVRAIDGDTQINKDIKYRLSKDDTYTFFNIDEDTGVLTVDGIDRDALKQEVFSFDISAYKYDNVTWETLFSVVIIVDDINDNMPTAVYDKFEIEIDEETFLSLKFEQDIIIEDIDLGMNAQYTVMLEDIEPEGASEAFMIIPNEGYQRQTFQITIVRANLLDFERLDWQTVKFRIKAQEILDKEHVGYAEVTVNLQNWNDEEPIFPRDSYEETFLETVGAGFEVATIRAYDRDIDDEVYHSIMGSVSNYLNIDKLTGVITVANNDSFDYQRQDEIVVQVRAVDTLGNTTRHTAFAQLTIKLIDVNNKQPQLNLPRQTPLVEENVPDGHVISDGISGSDPDSSANITYSINWDESYATKQGRAADRGEYVGVVDILTVYPDPNNLGYAQGILVARELRDGVTIDFEMFEVLYLVIRLTDHCQEIGDDFSESLMAVMIEDLNDNPPVWTEGSLETLRFVREAADSDVIIGSVHATDIDGPLYNNITYWLFTSGDTREGLVKIDSNTGQLSVDNNRGIDADTPPTYYLTYTINATDCCFYLPQCGKDTTCHNTIGEIEISITDTNNKIPYPREGQFDTEFCVFENETTGYEIGYIVAGDLDRDEFFHQVSYDINYRSHPNLRNFFAIEQFTGKLFVELTTDQVLDRDMGVTYHDIHLILTDNHLMDGDRVVNTNYTEVRVTLLDVNDNAPELPKGLTWPVSENTLEGTRLVPGIYAPDIDEPDTDNSRVNYQILSLQSADRNIEYPDDLFGMLNPDNETGHLVTNYALKGFWGTWDILIRAHDYGVPQMSTNETYEITVEPYNFHDPVFTFPSSQGQMIRLTKERALPNVILYYTNNVRLDNIEATDEDGLHAGVVTFEIEGDETAKDYFVIENEGSNLGTLILTRELNDDLTTFQVTIRATDGGTDPRPRSTDITVTVNFVTTQGDPIFENNSAEVVFTEFSGGLEESQQLPLADDPKNDACSEDACHVIYYYILDGESSNYFQLHRTTNVLRLTRELDRSQALQHNIRVVASNSATQPSSVPSFDSILNIVVEVKDHDPRPIFTESEYTGGISVTDPIDKEILTVHATHSENVAIAYEILWETMVTDPSLQSVASAAFQMNQATGTLRLNFQQQASMSGMLDFQVSATDPSNRMDKAHVTIYLISDDNRVVFRFINELIVVERERNFIEATLTRLFETICSVDWIVRASDHDGNALDRFTDVRAHFIRDNVAVDARDIEIKRSDIILMVSLREALYERGLSLDDLSTNLSNISEQSRLETILTISLGILAAILAIMCVTLVVYYCITTRRLKRRLDGLLTTKFGSVGSGLNGVGSSVPVPGANKHAAEGTNPVWNKTRTTDFDTISDTSGDSDLIGIEDNPQFSYGNQGFSADTEGSFGGARNSGMSIISDNPSPYLRNKINGIEEGYSYT